jgi:hypothetical protein
MSVPVMVSSVRENRRNFFSIGESKLLMTRELHFHKAIQAVASIRTVFSIDKLRQSQNTQNMLSQKELLLVLQKHEISIDIDPRVSIFSIDFWGVTEWLRAKG